MRLGVCIVYSSIDAFLWPYLRQDLEWAADDIVVVRRTHLFGGDPEPLPDLGVPTITMPHEEGSVFDLVRAMRNAGADALSGCSHVLFLDSDELFDAHRLRANVADCAYFAARYYWRTPNYRLVQDNEVAGLMVRRDLLRWGKEGDREKMAENIARPRPMHPFMHHFSWAKPLPEILKKVRNWGHRHDRANWSELVMREWSSPVPQHDFVHKKARRIEPCVCPLALPEEIFHARSHDVR